MNTLWMIMMIEVGVLVAGAYGLVAWVQGSANVLRWTMQSPYSSARRGATCASGPGGSSDTEDLGGRLSLVRSEEAPRTGRQGRAVSTSDRGAA